MNKSLFLLLFGLGCSSPYNAPQRVQINQFELNIMELEELRKVYKETYHGEVPKVLGFCDYINRKLFVPYSDEIDDCGHRKPNFEVLGHELYHLQELGGSFHDGRSEEHTSE